MSHEDVEDDPVQRAARIRAQIEQLREGRQASPSTPRDFVNENTWLADEAREETPEEHGSP